MFQLYLLHLDLTTLITDIYSVHLMAQSTYEKELQTEKIRKRLNADQIKLWLPPYTTTDKKQDQGNIPEVGIEQITL